MADTSQRKYNAPPTTPSDVGVQLTDHYFQKKALIEAVKEQYFGQLADVTTMPRNMGKKIVKYHYLPLLDDRNLNDQGIDAAGVTIDSSKWYATLAQTVKTFAVEADATAAAAAVNALEAGVAVKSGTATPWTVTVSKQDLAGGTQAQANAVKVAYPDAVVRKGSGNLYGSSKDVGFISGKLPILSETGGRVNRVGFKRISIEGTFENFGFFDEYTQDSVDFDSDDQLREHINREMVRGANELTEDALQADLLNSAGTVRYPGAATSNATLTNTTVVSYSDLMHLSIDLDNNRTPKKTTMITGTRLVDTRTISGARVAYIGSELIPTLKRMKDLHNNPAFIPVEKYAAGGTVLNGEIGMVDGFRFVVVPEMMRWEGAGAAAGAVSGFYTNGTNFNVYPILVVGDEAFTTIGFQTDGKSVKFKIYHKAPGENTVDRNDPYGKTGLMSIQWWYGFMALRPERIALLKTTAQM